MPLPDRQDHRNDQAQPPMSENDRLITIIYGNTSITPQMAAAGAVLLVCGAYLIAFGFRAFRPTLAVNGLLCFGTVTWVGLINTQPAQGFSNNAITLIVVPAALGILGAILLVLCWNIAIYIVGAVGGLALALFVCCWHENHVISNDIGRACFLAGLPVLFACIAFFAERYMILFSTSFTGAFVLIVGIDLCAHTQYLAGIISVLDRHHSIDYSITRTAYVMMAVTIFVFLLSLGWQYFYNAHRQFGVYVVQEKHAQEMSVPAEEEAVGGDTRSVTTAAPTEPRTEEVRSVAEPPGEDNNGKQG